MTDMVRSAPRGECDGRRRGDARGRGRVGGEDEGGPDRGLFEGRRDGGHRGLRLEHPASKTAPEERPRGASRPRSMSRARDTSEPTVPGRSPGGRPPRRGSGPRDDRGRPPGDTAPAVGRPPRGRPRPPRTATGPDRAWGTRLRSRTWRPPDPRAGVAARPASGPSAIRTATPYNQRREQLRLPDRPGPARQDEENRLERVIRGMFVAQPVPADAQHHRPMPRHQGREGRLGPAVPMRREPLEQLTVRQPGRRTRLEQHPQRSHDGLGSSPRDASPLPDKVRTIPLSDYCPPSVGFLQGNVMANDQGTREPGPSCCDAGGSGSTGTGTATTTGILPTTSHPLTHPFEPAYPDLRQNY